MKKVLSILLCICMVLSLMPGIPLSVNATDVLTGWQYIDGSWYYYNEDGTQAVNQWMQGVTGDWYYLGEDGRMVTDQGWQTIGSDLYYYDESGKYVTGWQQINGEWYYFSEDDTEEKPAGALARNMWEQGTNDQWYYIGADGERVTDSWVQDDTGTWYYLDETGVRVDNQDCVAQVGQTGYTNLADAINAANALVEAGETAVELTVYADNTLEEHIYVFKGVTVTILEGVTQTIQGENIALNIRGTSLVNNGTITGTGGLVLGVAQDGTDATLTGGECHVWVSVNSGIINGGTFYEDVYCQGEINGGIFYKTVEAWADCQFNAGSFTDIELYIGTIHYSDAMTISGTVYESHDNECTILLDGQVHTHTLGEVSYRQTEDGHELLTACTTCPFRLVTVTKEDHSYENGYCVCGKAESYDLYVAGVEVTADNASDVLGDGTVSFVPPVGNVEDEDYIPGELTLRNAELLDCVLELEDTTIGFGVYSMNSLKLIVEGDCTVTAGVGEGISAGIGVGGELTVSGTGTLTVGCGKADGTYAALYAAMLTVEEGATVETLNPCICGEVTNHGTLNALVGGDLPTYTFAVYGKVTLSEDLDISAWETDDDVIYTLTVMEGATLTVADGVKLTASKTNSSITNNGTVILEGTGTVVNNGSGTCGEGVKHLYVEGICLICHQECPHTGPYTVQYKWYPYTDGTCYVNAELYCDGCGEYMNYASGDAELVEEVAPVNCQNPGSRTWTFNCTLNGEQYSETHTETVYNDVHIVFDGNGFCTSCGGYQKPTVDSGEDPEWDYDDVYLIYNAGQLYWFADHVNNVSNGITGKLMDDIDLNPGYTFNADGTYTGGNSPRMWTPIGSGSPCYTGDFDGNGFTISGVYAVSEGRYVGLFGNTDYNYEIKNLGITNSYFEGADHVGGLIGYAYTTVKNCYVTDTVYVSGSYATAALIGYNGGEVYNSYAMADTLVSTNYGICYNCYALTEGDGITALTAEDFTSGKAAYLLGEAWGQTIGTDSFPVLKGDKVYQTFNCKGETVYSNTEINGAHIWLDATCTEPKTCSVCGATEGDTLDHDYENGFCTRCGGYQPATGSGTQEDPYKIGNAGQLYWFAARVNVGHTDAWAELTDNIVVNENVLNADGSLNGDGSGFRPWTPIGNSSIDFAGTFDGKDFTVSGLYFNNSGTDCVGLFGSMMQGSVRNVGVVASYLSGHYCVGGVAGYSFGVFTNCYSTGTVSGRESVGGVVGHNDGTITNSYNTGTVSGRESVGGVVGFNSQLSITNCYNTGDVSGESCVGGVVGNNYDMIYNCYSTGNVSGNSDVGGAVGWNAFGYDASYYYLDTCGAAGEGIAKTAEQFASGEVAYLLGEAFGQTIGADELPVLGGKKVYSVLNCANEIVGYSNAEGEALGHTDGPVTVENSIPSSCTTGGSYDAVVYCTVCGEETYRETVIEDPLGHREYTISGYPASCTEPGLTDGVACMVCGEILARQEEIPLVDHVYENGGCINCEATIRVSLPGSFNSWDTTAWVMTRTDDGIYHYNIHLNAGTYTFKVMDNGNWMGNNGTIVDNTAGYEWIFGDASDCTLSASGGTYDFAYNINTKGLKVDFTPDHVHTFAYSFTWSDYYTACTATGVCQDESCRNTVSQDCSIVSKLENGKLSFTATCGEYSDTVTVDEDTANAVYVDVGKVGWSNVNAYVWNSSTVIGAWAWPGTAMTHISGTVYAIVLPDGMDMIIFNNGYNQTEDLSLPSNGENIAVLQLGGRCKWGYIDFSCKHVEEIVYGYPASCTEPGLTDGIKCSVCGETIKVQETIQALGHSGDVYINNGNNHTYTCKTCAVTVTEAHSYTDGICICGKAKADSYELWVQGIQVTENNASDVLGDLDEGATVTYDAATGTLTLNNADLIGVLLNGVTDDVSVHDIGFGILAANSLNLNLIGTNTITCDNGVYTGNQGIQVRSTLTVDGGGILNISTGVAKGASYGIVTMDNFHIKSGNINVTAGKAPVSIGVMVRGEALIVEKEASLTASGDPDGLYFGMGIDCMGSITNNGAIRAVAIVVEIPVETLWVYGNAVLAENTPAVAGYVFTEDSVLMINEDVTLDMSNVTADKITLDGSVVNNGTVILPDSYPYATIPTALSGGTLVIGESTFHWDGEKYVCTVHTDADNSGRCDVCNCLMQPAKLVMTSVSLKGNIAVNYYMLLSDEVLSDSTAYMQFTLADGEIRRVPVSEGMKLVRDGETYYVYTCAVNAKEMTDDILSQFFYAGGETKLHTYNVQTYAKHIIANYDDEVTKNLMYAMLNYGTASQLHFGYNTDDLANTGLAAPDYSNVTVEGFKAVAGQGTELAKFYSASLILKSETTLRLFFTAPITAVCNGQELEVKERGGLYYVDVVGISAKDLDEDVTVTINDGTNTAEVSFNPMSYCQGVLNDTTGAFGQDMKDLVAALYLYNQAANAYFKEV